LILKQELSFSSLRNKWKGSERDFFLYEKADKAIT